MTTVIAFFLGGILSAILTWLVALAISLDHEGKAYLKGYSDCKADVFEILSEDEWKEQ